jgi:hypothetical protein
VSYLISLSYAHFSSSPHPVSFLKHFFACLCIIISLWSWTQFLIIMLIFSHLSCSSFPLTFYMWNFCTKVVFLKIEIYIVLLVTNKCILIFVYYWIEYQVSKFYISKLYLKIFYKGRCNFKACYVQFIMSTKSIAFFYYLIY